MCRQAVKGLIGTNICADSHARMASVRVSLGQGVVLLLFAMCSSWFSSSKVVADVAVSCACNICPFFAPVSRTPNLGGQPPASWDKGIAGGRNKTTQERHRATQAGMVCVTMCNQRQAVR